MKKSAKSTGERTVKALLEKLGCPVPFHQVRTRFLGNIATPELSASPLQVVKGLWGGELPEFDSMDEVNELFAVLINGLWNDLTRHQKRSQPFRLVRVPMEPTRRKSRPIRTHSSRRAGRIHRGAVQRAGGHRPARAGA